MHISIVIFFIVHFLVYGCHNIHHPRPYNICIFTFESMCVCVCTPRVHAWVNSAKSNIRKLFGCDWNNHETFYISIIFTPKIMQWKSKSLTSKIYKMTFNVKVKSELGKSTKESERVNKTERGKNANKIMQFTSSTTDTHKHTLTYV